MNASCANQAVQNLHMDLCHMLDLAAGVKDCAKQNNSICVQCKIPGEFFTGEKMTDFNSTGHIVCLLMGILTVVAGIFGLFTNSLIIAVLAKTKKSKTRTFNLLLTGLAIIDLYCCGAAIIAQLARMALYGNWVHKGYATLQWYMASTNFALFGRSASLNMALLITIERFLVIAYPIKSRVWFTLRKTTLVAAGVFVVSILLNGPRFFNYQITHNIYSGQNEITSLRDFDYLIGTTKIHEIFYKTLPNIHGKIAFWLPWPALLLFNFLSIMQVGKLTQRRESLNRPRRKEIEGMTLFMPVVVSYVIANIAPFTHFLVIKFAKTLYRELSTAMILSIAINSSIHFHLYYYRNATFKRDTQMLLLKWRGIKPANRKASRPDLTNTSTGV
ncbi:unnamed protein product [Orchesella dallaii]|uniref:G-protein coupled receptors family 1 profile domain-containing protein n=1 Tax=Orchesella dallaii TaxID=48710 RepID=A0ABP1Q1N5_9HEXA